MPNLTNQALLPLDPEAAPAPFGGPDLTTADRRRLAGQLQRVEALMSDGVWRTLARIRLELGGLDSEAGISARLRDLRKTEFGGWPERVERKRIAGGMWAYRMVAR
jgi:hypothetical protein